MMASGPSTSVTGAEDVFSSDRPGTPDHGGTTSNLFIDTSYYDPRSAQITPRREHTIPVATPQKLARLEDMNADLQERIEELNEQLQEDTEASSHQVRRLEKELANLRAELSYTRERNEQLEAARQRDEEGEEELAKEHRRQRTEKLRAARHRRLTHGLGSVGSQAEMSAASGSSPRIMDFAPKPTPADLKRILSRAEGGGVDIEEPEDQSKDEDDDDGYVDSPTTTLAGSGDWSKRTTGESASFMERLTNIERATLNMQRANSRGLNSPAIVASPSLPPLEMSSHSPFSTISSRADGFSKDSVVNTFSKGAGPSSTPRRGSMSSLKPKRGHRMSVQRVALGNKAMLAMSNKASSSGSKGKSRASLTSMSFTPPSPGELNSSARLDRGYQSTAASSTLAPPGSSNPNTPRPSSLSLFAEAISSPLREFAFLNPLSPGGSLRSRLGLASPGALDNINAPTLKSELLGHEFGDDWRADFEERMFGDLDLSELISAKEDGDDDEDHQQDSSVAGSVIGSSSVAMNALSAALDPMRKGELREVDEHILPLGSLREAPNETFYLLDKAVAARPSVWTDTTTSGNGRALESGTGTGNGGQRRLYAGTGPRRKQSLSLFPLPITIPTLRIREDAWSLYPDEDVEDEDEGSEDMEPPPPGSTSMQVPSTLELIRSPIVRRERALGRMSQAHSHRLSASMDPTLDAPRRHHHGRRHHHRRSHRQEEPQSVLKSIAQRMGVPTNLVPSAVPGQRFPSYRQDDEFNDDDETEVEEHDPLRPSGFMDDEEDDYTEEESVTPGDSSEHQATIPDNTSVLARIRRQDRNAPGQDSDDSDRYNSSALAQKLQTTSMQTIVQVWMSVQFVALVVVFVYFAAKRGPTAILAGGSRGSASGPPAREKKKREKRQIVRLIDRNT